jgi:hypothetical protein
MLWCARVSTSTASRRGRLALPLSAQAPERGKSLRNERGLPFHPKQAPLEGSDREFGKLVASASRRHSAARSRYICK